MLHESSFCRSSVSSLSSSSSTSFSSFGSHTFPAFFQKKKRTGLQTHDNYVGAGIILVRFPPNAEPEYLLLRGAETGIWSFPKGHCEEQDEHKPFRTAIRETYEETGFVYTQNYTILGDMMHFGQRFYWIGVVTPASAIQNIRTVDREHSQSGWFTFSEMANLRGNHDVRVWTKKTADSYALQIIQDTRNAIENARPNLCRCPCPTSFSMLDMHLNASGHTASSASSGPDHE